ncbi:SWR1-complex protein 4 [Macrophomina phaseolina MS6]|uniref:SWR1-complex protein 4 n=2 Tax=Macrophomina phaseolina TaxID=35725 RepID=K2S3H3_MACPH|nr:SWR1-complex protein 4 [Macrophomina phaseolina MS6]KAH7043812.1 3-oxo-5-alpha-steroid 4-dehydrogenase-domain-containing protein [Macrophomina phaseolina]
MAIIQNWLPPSRENWELINSIWQLFPVLTAIQWTIDWYPQGKTSTDSRWNLPGKWAWFAMEIPGFITLLYVMWTLPKELNLTEPLAWGNWTMAGMFTVHYLYRAILAPLFLNPSMSPIHPLVYLVATLWQITNGVCLGGWLGGHGPRTPHDWAGHLYYMEIGLVIWGWGLLANMYHDDDLREIRRAAARRQKKEAEASGKPLGGVDKVYMLPKNGLFRWVLYAHYLCEWIEWAGFWMVGGWGCTPARSFLLNEVATMLPRAIQGKRWYVEKFGADKVGNRKAVIPGII